MFVVLGMVGVACTAQRDSGDVAAHAAKPGPPVTTHEPVAPAVPTPAVPGRVRVDRPPAVAVDGVVFPRPELVAHADFERVTPAWERVMEIDREVVLEPLARGVLARIGDGWHEVDTNGELVAARGLWSPGPQLVHNQRISGVWPEDAWYISEESIERDGSDVAFHTWDGERWIWQKTKGKGVFESDDFAVHRWSPRGGFLLVEQRPDVVNFRRLGGKRPPPGKIPLKDSGRVRDALESVDGTVFLFVVPDEPARSSGLENVCNRRPGEILRPPPAGEGGGHYMGSMAARGGSKISVEMAAVRDGSIGWKPVDHYIIHYEEGGWEVEAIPGSRIIDAMLAAPDGGLWLVIGDNALWHRSDAGTWMGVDLPPGLVGAKGLQMAMHRDRLWVVGKVGERHVIHATAAILAALGGPGSLSPGG